jgi:hypothetical protein
MLKNYHMDRLRYKPKNITKEGLIDVSAEPCSIL